MHKNELYDKAYQFDTKINSINQILIFNRRKEIFKD